MPKVLNKTFEPNYSSQLNIESIISAPLIAASKSNVVMLTGQTRFLLDYCFERSSDGGAYEPVMINMIMTKGVLDPSKSPGDPDYVKIEKMTFSVPLLCLIPLNSLAIDKVNVDFDMEITSMTSHSYESDKSGVEEPLKKGCVIKKSAQLNGKISHRRNDTTDSGNSNTKNKPTNSLVVNINAGPLPLPVGVLTILDLYAKTIQPLPQSKLTDTTT